MTARARGDRDQDRAEGARRTAAPSLSRLAGGVAARALPFVDATLVLGFFLLTVQLRRPYKMLVPYAWDSLLFVRALDHFNATRHEPQPPGYLFYVSIGRLLRLATDDAQRALVWTSILASAAAVAALYLLGRLLHDRVTGAIAAGLLMTSVTFWFYGEIVYPYTTLAAGSVVLALIALALRRGLLPGGTGASAAALAALAFGLVAGFRQDLLLFLSPLYLVAMWGRPLRHWIVAAVAGALGILIWLLPTAALSEGLAKYLAATSSQGGSASAGSSAFAGGLPALRANGREVATFLWRGLYFALPPLLYFLGRTLLVGIVSRGPWAVSARSSDVRPRGIAGARRLSPFVPWPTAFTWVLLWLALPLSFYTLAHIGDYGYTFSALPALMLLAARGVVLGARDGLALLGGLLGLVARGTGHLRPGEDAPGLTPLWRGASVVLPLLLGALLVTGDARLFLSRQAQFSVAGIYCFDATMQARVGLVSERFSPRDTLIFSAGYYQHVRHYLQEYPVWLYDPTNGTRFERTVPEGIRFLVIFDEVARVTQPAQPADQLVQFRHFVLPCNGAPFHYALVSSGDVVRYEGATTTVTVQRNDE